MMEFVFTLKYQLAANNVSADSLIESLAAAGCDDALVGTGRPGRLALEFTREANNAEAAVRSAMADVQRAVPSAKLIEASPDLVGLSDVAEVVGVSRQAVRKMMLTNQATFPVPVHDGQTVIWHLVDVLEWLSLRDGYHFESHLLDIARAAQAINAAKASNELII